MSSEKRKTYKIGIKLLASKLENNGVRDMA